MDNKLYNILRAIILEEMDRLEHGHTYDERNMGKIRELTRLLVAFKYAKIPKTEISLALSKLNQGITY